MESYPGDLVVGFFPLVIAVNAILNHDNNGTQQQHRGIFDRFLDSMAASLAEDDTIHDDGSINTAHHQTSPTLDASYKLTRGRSSGSNRGGTNLEYYSDDEMDHDLLSVATNESSRPTGSRRSLLGTSSIGLPRSFGGSHHQQHNHHNHFIQDVSYAKALQQGQGFFQRARIVSASPKHGFPPSKDPEALHVPLKLLLQQTHNHYHWNDVTTERIKRILSHVTLDGVLSEGWLEKHVHALPSALLVVVQVNHDQQQQRLQDEHLMETIEHLQYSLAPKRACQIHIVALVKDNSSIIQAEQWSITMMHQLAERMNEDDDDEQQQTQTQQQDNTTNPVKDTVQPPPITLLRVTEDLQSSSPCGLAMQQLYRKIRDASIKYYAHQARRAKQKLLLLTQMNNTTKSIPPPLLPLAVRYCFKVGIFYEFQWKHEKSLQYMGEAYRHLQRYYRYLITTRKQQIQASSKDATHAPPPVVGSPRVHADDSVEVSLLNSNTADFYHYDNTSDFQDAALWSRVIPPPPDDMEYQCHAIADWLNLKLLLAGLQSRTPLGLSAAALQWRKHLYCFLNANATTIQPWFFWKNMARQRLVLSQLIERHPPQAIIDQQQQELIWLFCAWRAYQAAAEAHLQLAKHVAKQLREPPLRGDNNNNDKIMRKPFVGGLDKDGLMPKLKQEASISHREKALELITRAIFLFEHDFCNNKQSEKNPWNRSGARMHYLAGGILLGMGRHLEATQHLEKASHHAHGWNGLELVIRRMLIECYEKHLPSEEKTVATSSQTTIASMILDSYFNAKMSSRNLRRALEHFATRNADNYLQWYHSCYGEADSQMPFTFAVTFPKATHATAGDTVQAAVMIDSRLDYAVHVKSVTLLTMAGPMEIAARDLLSAQNATEGGSDGGIIVQAKTSILLTTDIVLPKDMTQIAVDESGNGGEKMGTPGKGSFSKSARPRTAGITSAAGARLVSEQVFGTEARQSSGQWSLRSLGGKPLHCDGMRMVFFPVHVGASINSCRLIELTMEKKKPKTAANIKRTPFEEDNYVASAWSRPYPLPWSLGPKCLRVLGPMPQMKVENITDGLTHGKAMEGTINRILLRLEPGLMEHACSQIQFQVRCDNMIVTSDGKTKHFSEDGEKDEETVDPTNPSVRTPTLVRRADDDASSATRYGYNLPAPWTMEGTNGVASEWKSVASQLKEGEHVYVYFDLYRPAAGLIGDNDNKTIQEEDNNNKNGDVLMDGKELCQTDFDVAIRYRQERPTKQPKPMRRGPRRKAAAAPPEAEEAAAATPTEDQFDWVSLDYSGSVVWTAPLSASFVAGTKKGFPSGSRHPSNVLANNISDQVGVSILDAEDGSNYETALVDGEQVSTKCVLRAEAAADSLAAELVQVRFENDCNSDGGPCDLSLVSSSADNNGKDVLYQAKETDPSRNLSAGRSFSVVYTLRATMPREERRQGGISASLGVMSVDWRPIPLPSPDDMETSSSSFARAPFHGPLVLDGPLNIRFRGPPCYIEDAPFEAALETFSEAPQVAVPFEIKYRIKNKTATNQRLAVMLEDADNKASNNNSDELGTSANSRKDASSESSQGIFISGLLGGEIDLAPFESRTLAYTALATKAGLATMPRLAVSSKRFNTWIIREGLGSRHPLFVLP